MSGGKNRGGRSGGSRQLHLNQPPTTPAQPEVTSKSTPVATGSHTASMSTSDGPVALSSHPLFKKYQTLPTHLSGFFQHDWEHNKKLTCLLYYEILRHFDPETKARPKQKKELLVGMFRNELRPKLVAFCRQPPPADMETENDDGIDFDPKGRRTTKSMLEAAIKRKKPNLKIPASITKDGLLCLFKHYVDRDLRFEPSISYSRIPRVVQSQNLSSLTLDELRFGLHTHAPEIFLHLNCLLHQDMIDLYKIFVLEEKVENDDLIEGYHYSTILDMPQPDEPSQTMKE